MTQDQTPAEDRQDPADQYQTDTAVETEEQPGADEDGFGGDAPEPAEPAPVQTEEPTDIKGDPEDAVSVDVTKPPADEEAPTIILAGETYTIDQNKGYRKQV